ncbi:restriction endonuclease subunit S [Streptomyces sp. NPDC007920]|uniref:restriction endonuclease subunit S n=1 Tax=unclassified Streptomyces TaxID=2593676 RepID=UPI0036C59E74
MSGTGIPAKWAEVHLADVLSEPLINGRSVRSLEGGFPVLRLTAIKNGRIDLTESKEGEWTAKEAVPFRVTKGDFLLSRGNGSVKLVGRGGIVGPIAKEVAFPDTMIRVRVDPRLMLPDYLRLLWDSPLVRQQIESKARTTAGIYKINQTILEGIRFPLPPKAEQQRIVEALEAHLSRLDAACAYLDHAQRLAPLQVRSINTAAATGLLFHSADSDVFDFDMVRREIWHSHNGKKKYKDPVKPDASFPLKVPDNWVVHSLEAVTDPVRIIRYGILMPKVRNGGVVPYVEVKDLRGCTLQGKALHLTSAELDEQFAGARIKHGDVVLAVRGSYDRSAVVPDSIEKANLSRDVARIAPLPGLLPEFLQIFLQSGFAQRYLKTHARGVAVKGVNISALRSMPIAVPPLTMQKEIVSLVENQGGNRAKAEASVQKACLRAKVLRKTLLNRAFTGALVPQDPEDEPVSALLARIQGEQATQPRAKRTRRAARKAAAKS